jgi:tetratricopeptide (TPR) repeat protein
LTAAASLREHDQISSALYAGVLRISAWTYGAQGKVEQAFSAAREAMLIAERLDDDLTITQVRACMAEIEFTAGNVERAIELSEWVLGESLVRREAARNAIEALCNLASFRLTLGKTEAAAAAARGAITRAQGRYPTLTHWVLQHLGAIAALRGDIRSAARLLSFVDSWAGEMGFERHPVERNTYELAENVFRSFEDREELETFREQGARLTFESASELALSV